MQMLLKLDLNILKPMQSFPNIIDKEVVLMLADRNTGVVLDDKYEFCISNLQKVYTVFNTFEDALAFIRKIKKEKSNIEFVIYGKDKKVLKIFDEEY